MSFIGLYFRLGYYAIVTYFGWVLSIASKMLPQVSFLNQFKTLCYFLTIFELAKTSKRKTKSKVIKLFNLKPISQVIKNKSNVLNQEYFNMEVLKVWMGERKLRVQNQIRLATKKL